MKLPIKILLIFPILVAFCCDSTSVAQNPLRLPANGTLQRGQDGNGSAPQQQINSSQVQQQNMSAEVRAALYGNEERSENSNSQPIMQPETSSTTYDANVRPAANTEAEIPKNDLGPVVRMLENFQPNDAQPERDLLSEDDFGQPLTNRQLAEDNENNDEKKEVPVPGAESSKLQDVAEKVIYNTLIVLSIGIGFVFVAKMFLKPKGSVASKANDTDFKILSSMKLSPKSNLMLVEIGDDRLVIATDPTGIKSVVRLAESFASTLGEFENSTPPALQNPTGLETRESSGTYSLSSIGKAIADANSSQSGPDSRGDDEEAIRKKMEVALAEHGLKELVLNTLQKSKT